MSGHVSLHSLAAAQTRDARDADERRRQTWAFVTLAAVVGLAPPLLLER